MAARACADCGDLEIPSQMVIDCRRAVAICKQCALIQESKRIESTSERTESHSKRPDLPELQTHLPVLNAKQKENEVHARNRLLFGTHDCDRSEEKELAFWEDWARRNEPPLVRAARFAKFAFDVRKAFDDEIIYGKPLWSKPLGFMVSPPRKRPPVLTLEDLQLNGYQLPKDFEQYDRIYQAAKPKGRNEISNHCEFFGVPVVVTGRGPAVQFRYRKT